MVRYSHGVELLLVSLCMLTASCDQSSGYTASGDLENSRGRINVSVTDAPVDFAAEVYVQFSGIEFSSSTQTTTLHFCEDPSDPTQTLASTSPCAKSKPAAINLLAMNGGSSARLLNNYPLNAGHYDSVRLLIDVAGSNDSYIVLNSRTLPLPKYELDLPSDAEAGLKLNNGFDIITNGHLDLIIDFDLRKSVRQEGVGVYKLRPSLRMVNNGQAGFIYGSVFGDKDPALTDPSCTSAVYVYSGWGATTGDVGSSDGPLTSAVINVNRLDNNDYAYGYRAAFLVAGNYTVAYTCQAAIDNPGTADNISFLRTVNVTVPVQAGALQNFQ